jgi:HAD superfamily hydrolase (TIGR01484 family)
MKMRYHALAVDYDGTLAADGQVDTQTLDALSRLKKSGRRLVLVTGRIIPQLRDVFPQMDICDLIVADNGALLYDPRTNDQVTLADRPPEEFIDELSKRGVTPIEVGDVIVATWEPHESTVLEVIRDMGLEFQIIFNKGAVMILPTGINKATGLRAALTRLGLSHHNTVGIGDAENDEAFLRLCAASVAVDNALDVVKRQVDLVTCGARGAGVSELIERLIADDLRTLPPRPDRGLLLGIETDDREFRIPLYGNRIAVIGESVQFQVQYVCRMLQQLNEQDYQACLFTANSEYLNLTNPVVLGTADQAPDVKEVLQVAQDPHKSCIINLQHQSPTRKTIAFMDVLQALLQHQRIMGHPHLLIVDDADGLIPADVNHSLGAAVLNDLGDASVITIHPQKLSEKFVREVELVMAVGPHSESLVATYAGVENRNSPDQSKATSSAAYDAVAWLRGSRDVHHLRALPAPKIGSLTTSPLAIR